MLPHTQFRRMCPESNNNSHINEQVSTCKIKKIVDYGPTNLLRIHGDFVHMGP